jgi:hypothetical protein
LKKVEKELVKETTDAGDGIPHEHEERPDEESMRSDHRETELFQNQRSHARHQKLA